MQENKQDKYEFISEKIKEVKLFDILFELIDVLSIVSIFFKNPQFKNEHEYRIVIVNVFGTLNSKPTNIVEKTHKQYYH